MPQEQRPTEKFRTSVGGQALMEGIMMRGPEKSVMRGTPPGRHD
ncbi:MAG: hypothetical protein ACLUOB_05050 [Subdoligranulum sp.]